MNEINHTIYQTREGDIVPSVTTVLKVLNKPALLDWAWRLGRSGIDYHKVMDDTAGIGTLVHQKILDYLRREMSITSNYTLEQLATAEKCFQKYLNWEKEHDMQPIMLEAQLVSEKYKFGGTLDNYCFLDDIPTLIDYKTSKAIYEDYFYQLAGYKLLLEEYDYSVEQCLILRIGKDENDGFEVGERNNLEVEKQIFLHCLEIYHLRGGI